MKEATCMNQKNKWTGLVLVDAITFAKNQKSLKQFYPKSKFACSREHDIISSENREHATCQKGISPLWTPPFSPASSRRKQHDVQNDSFI